MGKRPDLVILFILLIRLPVAGALVYGGLSGAAFLLYGLTEVICIGTALSARSHSPRSASV